MQSVQSEAGIRKMSAGLSDEELWRSFADGDDSAYTLLYFRYADRLYSYLRLLLGLGPERHYIEDVFQETWIKVYKEKEKLEIRNNRSFSGWLFRVAHNYAISLARRPHYVSSFNEFPTEQFLDTYASTATGETLSDERSAEEVLAILRSVVEAMPISFKEVYLLSEFEKMGLDEITDTLGISKANAKVRLFRARKMVRERMIEILGIDKIFASRPNEEE